MYANNLFTLNNIPTLSMQGGLCVVSGPAAKCGSGIGNYSISPSDRVFVSVVQHGRTLFDRLMAGAGSVAEIMDMVQGALKDTVGLVTVNIRNASQGWSRRRTVRFNSRSMMFPPVA